MYITVLRLIWPFILRRSAGYAAGYLESRRKHRQKLAQPGDERSPDCPPCPPCPAPAAGTTPVKKQYSTSNLIFFVLSGVMLTGALGLIGYLIIRDNR